MQDKPHFVCFLLDLKLPQGGARVIFDSHRWMQDQNWKTREELVKRGGGHGVFPRLRGCKPIEISQRPREVLQGTT